MLRLKCILLQIVIFCFSTQLSWGQGYKYGEETCITSIYIFDSTSKSPILGASISILDKLGNFTEGTISGSNGLFYLKKKCNDIRFLRITSTNYKEKLIYIPSEKKFITDKDTIFLSRNEKTLKEVAIVSKKKRIEYQGMKTIFHVDQDPDAKYSYTYDIIQKIPGIYSDHNNNITINGNTNILYLINGRKSALFKGAVSDLLKSFPASNIKDIEIQNNPSPRYSSEGYNVVVNIILNRKNVNGYDINLNSEIGSPKMSNQGGSFTIRNNFLNFSTSINSYNKFNPTATNKNLINDLDDNKKVNKEGDGSNNSKSKFLNSQLDLELDSTNLISFNFSAGKMNGSSEQYSKTSTFFSDGTIASAFDNPNLGGYDNLNLSWGADYELRSKKRAGRSLTASFLEAKRIDSSFNSFEIIPFKNASKESNNSKNNEFFNEKTYQINLSNPFRNHEFEIGTKWIHRYNESDYFLKYLDTTTSEYLINPKFSDEFKYLQDVFSGYFSLDLNFKKHNFNLGASAENVIIDANFKNTNTLISSNFFNIIPSISYSNRFNNVFFRLGYTQNLERPSLFYLNPYIDLSDPFFINYGNPNLVPALNNNYSLALNFFKKRMSFNLSLNYTQTNNSIQSYTIVNDQQISETTYGNIGFRSNFFGNLGMNFNILRVVNLSINCSPNYQKYSSLLDNIKIFREGFSYIANSSLSINFGKGWRLNSNANFNSSMVSLQGSSSSMLNTSVNIYKDFGKKKNFTLNINITNPHAKTRNFTTEIFNERFYLYSESVYVIRQYSLRINYRFNKFQGKVIKKKTGIQNNDLKDKE